MHTVLIAFTLTVWTQLLCVDGTLGLARLPTLRYRIFHTAARIVRHGRQTQVRLQADWPWTDTLIDAFDRLARTPRTRHLTRP